MANKYIQSLKKQFPGEYDNAQEDIVPDNKYIASLRDYEDNEKKRTFGGVAGDIGVAALKGAVQLPQAVVGLADIPTGGRVGNALESVGYKPKQTLEYLDTLYSPAQQEANRQVQGAEGFLPTLGAIAQNPSTIGTTAIESLPSMGGGGVIAKGAMKVLPKILPKLSTTAGRIASGAFGEGAISAGSTEEQIRGQTPDNLTTPTQSGLAALSGLGTGLIGGVSGKIANKFGISDIDTLAVGGTGRATNQGILSSIGKGAVSEGLLEEAPQSAQEQALQNIALDKPALQGVGNAAAIGAVAGGVIGGAVGPLTRAVEQTTQPIQPIEQDNGGSNTNGVNVPDGAPITTGVGTDEQSQPESAPTVNTEDQGADTGDIDNAGVTAGADELKPYEPKFDAEHITFGNGTKRKAIDTYNTLLNANGGDAQAAEKTTNFIISQVKATLGAENAIRPAGVPGKDNKTPTGTGEGIGNTSEVPGSDEQGRVTALPSGGTGGVVRRPSGEPEANADNRLGGDTLVENGTKNGNSGNSGTKNGNTLAVGDTVTDNGQNGKVTEITSHPEFGDRAKIKWDAGQQSVRPVNELAKSTPTVTPETPTTEIQPTKEAQHETTKTTDETNAKTKGQETLLGQQPSETVAKPIPFETPKFKAEIINPAVDVKGKKMVQVQTTHVNYNGNWVEKKTPPRNITPQTFKAIYGKTIEEAQNQPDTGNIQAEQPVAKNQQKQPAYETRNILPPPVLRGTETDTKPLITNPIASQKTPIVESKSTETLPVDAQVKKGTDGKFRVFYRGTGTEVFPGKAFDKTSDAKKHLKEERDKQSEPVKDNAPKNETESAESVKENNDVVKDNENTDSTNLADISKSLLEDVKKYLAGKVNDEWHTGENPIKKRNTLALINSIVFDREKTNKIYDDLANQEKKIKSKDSEKSIFDDYNFLQPEHVWEEDRPRKEYNTSNFDIAANQRGLMSSRANSVFNKRVDESINKPNYLGRGWYNRLIDAYEKGEFTLNTKKISTDARAAITQYEKDNLQTTPEVKQAKTEKTEETVKNKEPHEKQPYTLQENLVKLFESAPKGQDKFSQEALSGVDNAERVQYVQENFLDIIGKLEDDGRLVMNGDCP